MPLFKSENLVRRGLPLLYVWMSFLAIIEVGISGYLTGKGANGGDYGNELRTRVRFALFTSLWTLVFGTLIAVGTLKRLKFINTGFTHLVYLVITLAFWIAVGASLQVTLSNGTYQHRTTIRACEWFGWLEAIFTVIAIPWCLFGVAHAQEGIRGSVAV